LGRNSKPCGVSFVFFGLRKVGLKNELATRPARREKHPGFTVSFAFSPPHIFVPRDHHQQSSNE